jgi:drug/metabolite transporter (DMT)-like permease
VLRAAAALVVVPGIEQAVAAASSSGRQRAHVAALTLLPLSLAQAVLSGGFVLLAVLAERFFGFQLGRRQWVGIVLVAVSLALLGLTGTSSGGDHSDYSAGAMILFEGVAIVLGMLLIFSGRMERVRAQYGVLLGAARPPACSPKRSWAPR